MTHFKQLVINILNSSLDIEITMMKKHISSCFTQYAINKKKLTAAEFSQSLKDEIYQLVDQYTPDAINIVSDFSEIFQILHSIKLMLHSKYRFNGDLITLHSGMTKVGIENLPEFTENEKKFLKNMLIPFLDNFSSSDQEDLKNLLNEFIYINTIKIMVTLYEEFNTVEVVYQN